MNGELCQGETPRYSSKAIPYVCPSCKTALALAQEIFYCESCDKNYECQGGIPNFRLFPDPYLTDEEDYSRTEFVIEALPRFNLPSLLEHYWSVSDVTPVPLRAKFIRSAMLGEKKGQRVIRILSDQTFSQPVEPKRVLELGSGTGSFLITAIEHYPDVVGVDIAMRWLHVSRRRFMDIDRTPPTLVVSCAEYLPFPDQYFDLIVCSATLEFTKDPESVLKECARLLTTSGSLYFSTVNRFSITQDPYVYLWGVGLLPRAWQAPYVKFRRNASYENITLFSYNEFQKLARKYFDTIEFALPDIDNDALKEFPLIKRVQVHIFRGLKKIGFISKLLLRITPQWDIKLSKPK